MKITFIGGGNMAQAIIGGLIDHDFAPARVNVVEISDAARERIGALAGVRCHADPAAAVPFGDIVVMAVKPQQVREAARALAPHLKREVVLSIAAGTRLADLSRWLGGYPWLARCMPNTPALIGEGISALWCMPQVGEVARGQIASVLEAVGEVLWVAEERLLDAVTAVSGSGPAYVFYFIEALERSAIALGLAPDQARRLALGTFTGASRLAAGSAEDAATLRARVTSKGGTTEAALASLNAAGVAEAIERAVRAAEERARQLAAQLGRED